MSHEWRCIHNHDAAELLDMLRLQYDECQTHEVHHGEGVVDHSRANLVGVCRVQEVDGTDDAQDGEEHQIHYFMVCDLRIIEQFLVVHELQEMVRQPLHIVGIGIVTR